MIRQFDVCATPSGGRGAPMLVVLQSHLLPGLDTVLVAPLISPGQVRGQGGVFIGVEVNGEALTIDLAQLATLPLNRLTRPRSNLSAHEDAIRRGLDRLFTGF